MAEIQNLNLPAIFAAVEGIKRSRVETDPSGARRSWYTVNAAAETISCPRRSSK